MFCKFLKNFTKFTGKKCAVVYSVIKFLAGDLQLYFEWAENFFFKKKEQSHIFLNKSLRSNGELTRFSENDLYHIN